MGDKARSAAESTRVQSAKPRAPASTSSTASIQASSNSARLASIDIASTNIASASDTLPHHETIQRSFGSHDISNVRTSVGGRAGNSASAIGADAFTVGDRIGFRDKPDLRLAAHEAAHTVQQQRGVQLDGGAGRPGDAYERHADEVASTVVAGGSAAALLDRMPRGGNTSAVQRKESMLGSHSDIDMLPDRSYYEDKGDIAPKSGFNIHTTGPLIDMSGVGGGFSFGTQPRKNDALEGFGHPNPIPDGYGRSSDQMTNDQIVLRLASVDLTLKRIGAMVAQDRRLSEKVSLSSMSIAGLTWMLQGGMVFHIDDPTWKPDKQKAIPEDPLELSRELVRTEKVFDRVYESLVEVATDRQQEEAIGGSMAATGDSRKAQAQRKGGSYDVAYALSQLDETRSLYVEATEFPLAPITVPRFNYADKYHGEITKELRDNKVLYYTSIESAVKDPTARGMADDIRNWAWRIFEDLAWLETSAQSIKDAREKKEDVTTLQQEFVDRASRVGVSIEAIGEYDSALLMYELLVGNSSFFGLEDAKHIRWRCEQMRDAALADDTEYLRVLVRDHKADPKVVEAFKEIPDNIKWSQLILTLAIMLVATIATAGVGIALSAIGLTATSAMVSLSWQFVLRAGIQALTFTLVNQLLMAQFPGMHTGPFWKEFLWNFGLFLATGGAGNLMRPALQGTSKLAAGFVTHMVNFGILQAYGFIRFAVENGRIMTEDEFMEMTLQNVIMCVAMTVLMKPLEGPLGRMEKGAELMAFKRKYGAEFARIETMRADLAKRSAEELANKPEATAEEMKHLVDEAKALDADLARLVDSVATDRAFDLRAAMKEAQGLFRRLEETQLPQLLREAVALDATIELAPTGHDNAWSFPSGRGDELAKSLTDGGFEIVGDTRTVAGRVIEAMIPGKGRVQFIERSTTEVVTGAYSDAEVARAKSQVEAEHAGGTRGRAAYELAPEPVQTAETVRTALRDSVRGLVHENITVRDVAVANGKTTATMRVRNLKAGTTVDATISIEVVPDLGATLSIADPFGTGSVHGPEAGHATYTISGDAKSGFKVHIQIEGKLASQADVAHNLRHEIRESAAILEELARDPNFDVTAAQKAGVFAEGTGTGVTLHDRTAALELSDLMFELSTAAKGYETSRVHAARNPRDTRAATARDAGEGAIRRLDAALDAMGFRDPATRAQKAAALLEILKAENAGRPGLAALEKYIQGYGARSEVGLSRQLALNRVERPAMRKALGPELDHHFEKHVPTEAMPALDRALRAGHETAVRDLVNDHATGKINDAEIASNADRLAKSVSIARHVGSTLSPSVQLTVTLKGNWRTQIQNRFGHLRSELLYVIRDGKTGQVLKVGRTASWKIIGRFGEYVTASNHTGRELVIDIAEVSQSGGVEGPLRESVLADLRKQNPGVPEEQLLPWDNTNDRLGREGPGTPGTQISSDWMKANKAYWQGENVVVPGPNGPAPPPRATGPVRPPKADLISGLLQAKGNVEVLAKKLGVGKSTLYAWLADEGIKAKDFKP